MAVASTSGRGRLFSYAFAESWRTMSYRLRASPIYHFRYSARVPDRLLIAPTDLRTSDATVAADIYAGRFILSRTMVETGGASVFYVMPPNDEWGRALHSFSWLRHLRASDIALARDAARALITDWMRYSGRSRVAFEPEVIAKRISSWLAQSPMILDGCDYPFFRRFMRSLTRQVHELRRIAPLAPAGLPRLRTMVALSSAALSMVDRERFVKQAARWLDAELIRQVLPDGGHITRSPGAVLSLLTDLLPVRQAFTARGIQPSRTLIAAIDRMMPMLRFFRHGDGNFARFNGMGDTPSDLVATVLAYDDARGNPLANAPHSGYQRLTGGPSLVIVDTGPPPPIAVSAEAHAGCLSFEMSVGRQPMIINCGQPGPGARLRRLSRTTAAHSTATVNETSSCRFLTGPGLGDRLGEIIISGPTTVSVERGQQEGGSVVVARHDGYVERYGIMHERRLKLSATGDRLEGSDSFTTPSGKPIGRSGKDSFAIRFHLHPSVVASRREGGRVIELALPEGEVWGFEVASGEAVLEESVLLSEVRGAQQTSQIVVYGRPQNTPSTAWRFRRVGLRGRTRLPDQDES